MYKTEELLVNFKKFVSNTSLVLKIHPDIEARGEVNNGSYETKVIFL